MPPARKDTWLSESFCRAIICTFNKLPNGVTDIILENFHEPILQDPIRKTGRGGGLALYINKKVCDQEQIEFFRPKFEGDGDPNGEFQFVKIHDCKKSNKTKLFVNVYRSPSRNVDNFVELLDNVLRSLDRHSRKHIVFTGDFNVDLVKYEHDIHEFLNFLTRTIPSSKVNMDSDPACRASMLYLMLKTKFYTLLAIRKFRYYSYWTTVKRLMS